MNVLEEKLRRWLNNFLTDNIDTFDIVTHHKKFENILKNKIEIHEFNQKTVNFYHDNDNVGPFSPAQQNDDGTFSLEQQDDVGPSYTFNNMNFLITIPINLL